MSAPTTMRTAITAIHFMICLNSATAFCRSEVMTFHLGRPSPIFEGLGRFDHLDRHAELLELRADLCGITDNDPGEAPGIDRSACRLVEGRRGLRTIFGRQHFVII